MAKITVELISVDGAILVLGSHFQLSRSTLFNPLDTLGHALSDHVDAVLLHVLSDLARHLLVKASQQDASHHHSGVTAQRSAESSTLQGDIGGTDQQNFPRGVGQREEIVA